MSNSEPQLPTPGQLLREAREQRKLTVADVALQLNLRVNLVTQIETDQLDSSLLDTFVRGYLRSYARLVKLPEQQVMLAFEQQRGSPAGPAKPMRTFSNRAELQATENRFMWLTYAIGFILVLMLVLWWWQTASPVADDAAVVSEQQQTAPEYSDDTSEVVNNQSAEQITDDSLSGADEPEQADLADFIAAETGSELASTSPVAIEADVIDMAFSDNCWIDVLDAEGNRIAYGTKQAGYSMTVTGKAPFVVTLGNPSVVKITLNNQPFDMSSLPAGRVAKFTLAEPD
tara:strand:+ start:2245 stop:3105 length:861 start_codon:yes stop_codon:yes gene_type:complete